MPTRPKEVDDIIKSYTKTKVPNFFIHAKDKIADQVEPPTNSTMNRIASKIPTAKISYCNSIDNFDYKMLMCNSKEVIAEDKKEIVRLYDYWSKRRNSIFNHETDSRRNEEELFVYQEIRRRIINEIDKSVDYIADCLIEFLYNERKNSSKQVLWACFGDVIIENLKNNLQNANPICPVCGKRFKKENEKQEYCSNNCYIEAKRERNRQRNELLR